MSKWIEREMRIEYAEGSMTVRMPQGHPRADPFEWTVPCMLAVLRSIAEPEVSVCKLLEVGRLEENRARFAFGVPVVARYGDVLMVRQRLGQKLQLIRRHFLKTNNVCLLMLNCLLQSIFALVPSILYRARFVTDLNIPSENSQGGVGR